jgi:site-specific DNA-methyltransferase (adenine-specific)
MYKIEDIINKIHCADCLTFLSNIPDESIDMILTSPPYDNLRTYQGFSFDFENIAKELYRIIKNGSVVVWVIGDATIDGSETGNSFKQALYFKKIGFNLHDTMIYVKDPRYSNIKNNRYGSAFEYMFIFSKKAPKTFNPIKRETIHRRYNKLITNRQKDGSLKSDRYNSSEESLLYNVWYYSSGYMKTTTDKIAYDHPAIFPDKLAEDHIYSWSNPNNIVLDPMCGSGTTCKASKKLNRNYIGIDVAEKYCDIAEKRLSQEVIIYS